MNNNNMRRKSSGQGGFNNNQRHKQRFGGGGGNHGGNRPRKNYAAMREKYLQQARDALAAGDRVLAENYFQHADHCFRMLAEEQASRPQRPQHQPQEQQATGEQPAEAAASDSEPAIVDDEIDINSSALPAFLKVNYEQAKQPGETPPVQDWEERDAG